MVGEGKGVKTVITEIFLNNDMKIYAKHIDGTAPISQKILCSVQFPTPLDHQYNLKQFDYIA